MRIIPTKLRAEVRSGWLAGLAATALATVVGGQIVPPSTVPAKPPRDVLQPSRPMPGSQDKSAEQLVKVTAEADVERIAPGESFLLAFIFDIESHWHIYWKEPGVSGGPTRIKVKAPEGFVIGRTLFPRPKEFEEDGGSTFGYEDQAVVFVEVTAPMRMPVGHGAFSADVSFMVCKEICLLGRAQPMFTLAMGSSGASSPNAQASNPLIAKFKERLPRPLSEASRSAIQFDGRSLSITLPAQGRTTAEFFPIEMPGITFDNADVRVEGDVVTVQASVEVNPQNARGKKMMVAGLVGLGDRETDPCFEFEIPAVAGESKELPELLGGPSSP